MSIGLVTKDLYRLIREVEALENQLRNAAPEDREDLSDRLRKTRAEQNRMRNVLEGMKGK